MKARKLGREGLEVGAIGLGCMGMSEFYGAGEEGESIATIHRALELGVTLLATADMYGPHTNDQLVGGAIRPGCRGMSELYGAGADGESIATTHRAPELGVTLLDTADMYGPHTNEQLVGRAIRDRRDRVVLATKFGIVRHPDGGRAIN